MQQHGMEVMPAEISSILQDLISVRLRSSEESHSHPRLRAETSCDLLPLLIEAWRRAEANKSHKSTQWRPSPPRMWLEEQHQLGARLTVGLVDYQNDALDRWLGQRLAWWPRGLPHGRRVGIVSSRVGRNLDEQVNWFAALRTVCAKLDPRSDLILTVKATTTARCLDRCSALFGLRILEVEVEDDDEMTLDAWLAQIRRKGKKVQNTEYEQCFLSPPVEAATKGFADSDWVSKLPNRDRAVVALSNQLYVLHVRKGGHYDALLKARLADGAWPPGSVFLALNRELVDDDLAQELQELGAVGWVLFDDQQSSAIDTGTRAGCATPLVDETDDSSAASLATESPRIVPMPSAENWTYLTHCTRRQNGPWPDQTKESYLDELIAGRTCVDHSALAALSRIIRLQRLIATARTIRGGFSVVSFTVVSVPELYRLHVFRPHLGRWDFEPYGICIRRNWLERLGARPVRYGSDELWNQLSARDRPFFQLDAANEANRRAIQWSFEREWRHLGDVELGQCPKDAALVFVPSEQEAQKLARISRWPVAIVSPIP